MEEIIEKVGFGPFQVLLFASTSSTIWLAAFGMMFMMYGNYNPGWECKDDTMENQTNLFGNNSPSFGSENFFEKNDACHLWKECGHVIFSNESSTVVTEWNLICDNAWISSLMITIEMCGILVGSWICGPLGDRFGRRISLFSGVVFLGVAILIAAFSVSWQMFTVLQFFIGVGIGGIVTAGFFYPMEFVGNWWRPILASFPIWGVAMMEFSLVLFIFKDWRNILIATAVFSFFLFIPVFWIPESIRWLAVNGKQDQIEVVVQRMVSWNKKPPIDSELIRNISNDIAKSQSEADRPSYMDLFKTVKLRKYSIKFALVWIIMAIAYFMISFGVKAFSGDFYLNIFIFSLADIPGTLCVAPVANTLGRRCSAILLLSVSAVFCFGVVLFEFIPISQAGKITIAFATVVKALLVGAWSIIMVISTELYPTFIRNIHLGYLNAVSRLGSIISSFMIPADGSRLYVPFAVSGLLLLFASALIFSVSESKGKPMVETLNGMELEKEPKLICNKNEKEQVSC